MAPGAQPRDRFCFPSPGPQQLLLCSPCIKSVPQQLSTDTPQPGIIAQVSGPGFLSSPDSSLDGHMGRNVSVQGINQLLEGFPGSSGK